MNPDNKTLKILDELESLAEKDLNPQSGKLFSHIYDHGIPELKRLTIDAYLKYIDKTMLDFTVYPSILKMETDIVKFANKIFHNQEGVGNYTYGGTESIILAMKACREYFREKYGKTFIPKAVLPATAHPAFYKAALYLGYKVKVITDLGNDYVANADALNEVLDEDTVFVAASAPSYPYGTMDDIKGFSEIAQDKKLWLHVDACIGGFVLPFIERLGHRIDPFDFRLEGVTSLSADLHKYGYAPKGASLILYRDPEYRLGQIYVHSKWPGYPLVNTTVLSSRGAGPLAASWAIIKYLGIEGFTDLTRRIVSAKNKIINGLKKLNLDILGRPVSSIVAFTTWDYKVFQICDHMKKRGWYIQAQPGSKKLGFPPSIHLTIAPIHDAYAQEFLDNLAEVVHGLESIEIDVGNILSALGITEESRPSDLKKKIDFIIDLLGIDKDTVSGEMSLINILIHEIEPDIVEYLLANIINRLFT